MENVLVSKKYVNLPVIAGCKPGGFGEDCANCCAAACAWKVSNNKKANKLQGIVEKTNGGCRWNGTIRTDYEAVDKIRLTGKAKNYFPYMGDLALADQNIFLPLVIKIIRTPQHTYTFGTKAPLLLHKKLVPVFELLMRTGYDVYGIKNLVFSTSVGMDKYKYRIDQLKVFEGFKKEVWFKPLIGPVHKPDLTDIDCIRINREKSCNGNKTDREYKEEWVSDIIGWAIKQRVRVYNDIVSNRDYKKGEIK